MTRGLSKMIVAGAIATIALISCSAKTAQADDRHGRHGHERDFSFSLNLGGYGGGYGFNSGWGDPYRTYYRPVVRPTCCHYERVYVPGHFTHCGYYVPGYAQLIRVCDIHGREVVGGY